MHFFDWSRPKLILVGFIFISLLFAFIQRRARRGHRRVGRDTGKFYHCATEHFVQVFEVNIADEEVFKVDFVDQIEHDHHRQIEAV